ncbi:MAG: ATP-binding protein [Mariprofundaceae bacterium]|nr:ATP-binding protein [Mariprofundaceae bacterium]
MISLDTVRKRCEEVGMNAFLSKSIQMDDILHALDAAFSMRQEGGNDMTVIESSPKFSVSKEDIQQLMHVFSHDLCNPLVNMEALLREVHACCDTATFDASKQEDVHDNLAMMGEVLAHMNGLVHGINSVCHAMFDEVVCERVDILSLLKRELNRYQAQCGITEHVSVSMQVSGSIWADPLWLGKMLVVLMENAFQAMGEEGSLIFEMEARSGLDVLVVRDNGVGVGESDLKYVFQPFFSLTGRKGMGLALLRAWVQAHGGKVWCESGVDVGSVFYMGFPARDFQVKSDRLLSSVDGL